MLSDVIAVEALEKQVSAARREYPLTAKTHAEWMETAVKHNVLSESDAKRLSTVYAAKMNVINVDDFGAEEFHDN